MRIDKFLSQMGEGSRSDVKKLLAYGRIKVNGTVVKQAKVHINPETDEVRMGDRLISYTPFVYLMLNKPAGYISATRDGRIQTVLDLVPTAYKHLDLFPAGRLDRDTVGLMLITNDGQLAHKLLSPKYHVHKTYRVTAASPLTDRDIETLENGVIIGQNYKTLPAKVQRIEEEANQILLSIREGKYHQVKEMLLAVDNQVIFLERVSFGPLHLDGGLSRGEIRELTEVELEALFDSCEGLKL
jgi:16S rRNA pseudouridine516 synthase